MFGNIFDILKRKNNEPKYSKEKNKILFIFGYNRNNIYRRMNLEMLLRAASDSNNEIFILDCKNNLKTHCWCGKRKPSWRRCRRCFNNWYKIAELCKIPKKNFLKIKNIPCPDINKFESIKEAINYCLDGYNIGLGPISSLMTMTRDYKFDLVEMHKFIKSYMQTCYVVIKNLEKFHKIYNFDEIHDFNARFPLNYAGVSFAQKNGIKYKVWDRGANLNKIWIVDNHLVHDFDYIKQEVSTYWNNQDDKKIEKAHKWFKDRKNGKFQAIDSFTKDQIEGLLPSGFDKSKENIVFFNTSIDEVYAYDCWSHPFKDNENELLEELLEHYKDDPQKHFYLRIHPNLTKAKLNKATQIRIINEIKEKYKNLTVIEPDDKIDTYTLIDLADKVLVSYSTVGCEATYYGKVSILAGKAPYEDLDCSYIANSMQELYSLIDNKNLQPKPKDNCLPYGYYYETLGSEFEYCYQNNPNENKINETKLDYNNISKKLKKEN